MNDISNKELRALAIRTSLECPGCGALLHLMCKRELSLEIRRELNALLMDRQLLLWPLEDGEEWARQETMEFDPVSLERFRQSKEKTSAD